MGWSIVEVLKECSGSFEDVSGNTVRLFAEFQRTSKERLRSE